MRRQPRVMQWSLEGTIDSSLAQTESWVLARVKRRWTFVVERKLNLSNTTDPPEPIGSLAIRLPVESEKAPDFQVSYPELGFMLDETFHGEGYATEAVRALLESFWAETKGWDVVEAYVGPANQGSLRVIAKCGFEYWTEDGEDHVYRLTRPKK
jgi:RimJ/RimL family protein N-acetyltransferase